MPSPRGRMNWHVLLTNVSRSRSHRLPFRVLSASEDVLYGVLMPRALVAFYAGPILPRQKSRTPRAAWTSLSVFPVSKRRMEIEI